MAMGSPLFHMRIVKNWLQKCALDFKPRYYQRYFDDILVLFTLPDNQEVFRNFVNCCCCANMLFTIENEKQDRMPSLEERIICENK